jgi:hypothetical protein
MNESLYVFEERLGFVDLLGLIGYRGLLGRRIYLPIGLLRIPCCLGSTLLVETEGGKGVDLLRRIGGSCSRLEFGRIPR